jgi:hypothetical protein
MPTRVPPRPRQFRLVFLFRYLTRTTRSCWVPRVKFNVVNQISLKTADAHRAF